MGEYLQNIYNFFNQYSLLILNFIYLYKIGMSISNVLFYLSMIDFFFLNIF